jgi:hypothetical protein
VRALRRKPLIILRLNSWLQLDFVHTEHLWHCRSSPLLTNHLSHLLMVATGSRQEIPRTVTANPRTRLCLRSGVILRRTVCTWASHGSDRVRPNVKPLQRHKGVVDRTRLVGQALSQRRRPTRVVPRAGACKPAGRRRSCGPMPEGSVVAAGQGLRRSWWRTSICGTTGPCRKSEANRRSRETGIELN